VWKKLFLPFLFWSILCNKHVSSVTVLTKQELISALKMQFKAVSSDSYTVL
jgi:hypothetical protein